MNPDEQLKAAQEKMRQAETAWRSSDLADFPQRRLVYAEAEKELLSAERLVAAEVGLPYAVEWQPDGKWPNVIYAPLPLVFSDSLMVVVIFDTPDGAIQVLFEHVEASRYSRINDEVIEGHPLYGRGLSAYGLFTVENSPWVDELRQCHSVHSRFNPSCRNGMRHYLMCFKDQMFEAVTSREPIWKSFPTTSEALASAATIFERAPWKRR